MPAATLLYDPLLRLRESSNSAGTTRFAYDGLAMIAEYDGGDIVQKRYVFGPGIDEPLVEYAGANTASRKWLHADERGSVIAASDDSGAVTQINAYDEFGKPQSTNAGRFQYTGQMWLPELNAYYYKARVYAPELGRFLQTDPIGYADSPNLYTYVLNDPVNLVDPLGLALDQDTATSGVIINCIGYDWCGTMTVTGHRIPGTAAVPWGGGLGSGSGGSGGGGGGGSSPQKEQTRKISPCMQKFLASKGLGGSNLGSVVFHNGDGGSLIASAAFAIGNPAITVQNNVYVAPGHWNSFREGTSGFFEEAVHSMQWDVSGAGNFVFAWALGSVAGKIATWDAHNSPLEAQAMGMSVDLAKAYSETGAQCGRGG